MASELISYRQFLNAYQAGVAEIDPLMADLQRLPAADQEDAVGKLQDAAKTAFERLAATPYGHKLTSDSDLNGVLDKLEAGLGDWIDTMQNDSAAAYGSDHPAIVWATEDCYEFLRAFHFWGRLGGILYHFRDRNRALSTTWERNARTVFRQRADTVIELLDELAADVVIQAVYKDGVLNRMRQALGQLQRLKADLAKSPLDIDDAATNPLQDGETIIRRQFVFTASLLAFELYGHITPLLLDRLLELKSSTVEDLSLIPWPISMDGRQLTPDSRKSMMRDHIRDALKTARRKARKHQWITRDVIEYFAANPEMRESFARRIRGAVKDDG